QVDGQVVGEHAAELLEHRGTGSCWGRIALKWRFFGQKTKSASLTIRHGAGKEKSRESPAKTAVHVACPRACPRRSRGRHRPGKAGRHRPQPVTFAPARREWGARPDFPAARGGRTRL